MEKRKILGTTLLLMATVLLLNAGRYSGTQQSSRLYTEPDPAASGGISGRIISPDQPLFRVCAINTHDPAKVYKGQIKDKGQGFVVKGLPVGKYDLLLVYETCFFEGLSLGRGENNLTADDKDEIEKTIMESVPFFDKKKIHRLAGKTGKAGKARCVLQEVREGKTLTQAGTELGGGDIQPRSFKLAMLEDVGIGWQLVDTRELVRMEAGPNDRKGILPHKYSEKLGDIRVIDSIKDIGNLNLR